MAHRWFETGSKEALDEITADAALRDPPWTVRKALEELSPCESGYLGMKPCGTCAAVEWCACVLDQELRRRFPKLDWRPAIREVLGMS